MRFVRHVMAAQIFGHEPTQVRKHDLVAKMTTFKVFRGIGRRFIADILPIMDCWKQFS